MFYCYHIIKDKKKTISYQWWSRRINPRWPRPRLLGPNKEFRYLGVKPFVIVFLITLYLYMGATQDHQQLEINFFSPLNSLRWISLLSTQARHLTRQSLSVCQVVLEIWYNPGRTVYLPRISHVVLELWYNVPYTCQIGSWIRESSMLISVSEWPSQKLKSRVAS